MGVSVLRPSILRECREILQMSQASPDSHAHEDVSVRTASAS